MGYYKDLGTSIVAGFDEVTGYPVNEYGHLLSIEENPDPKIGDEVYNLTSPYGFLHFAIGDDDNFVCMGWRRITGKNGKKYAVLHAVVNSETGGFIDRFAYEVVPVEEARAVAMGITDNAFEWVYAGDVGGHSKSGWNQDGYYFYRDVCCTLADNKDEFTERQLRYGGKRINAFCGI